MKRLSLCVLLFSVISGNITNGCLNVSIQNVNLYGTDFVYILQWSNVGLPADAVFSVQYKRYGENEWFIKPECQNISRLYCNLTNDIISDDFMDYLYNGQVKATSKNCSTDWAVSNRFYPRYDTHIAQLELNFIPDVNSITIFVQAPSVPVTSEDEKPQTLEDVYSDEFDYHMSLSNDVEKLIWQKTQADHTFEISGLSPGTKYNGSVYLMIVKERKSDIRNFVVKTLPDHTSLIVVVCGFVLFACLLGLAFIYLGYKYVNRLKKTPVCLGLGNTPAIQPMEPLKDQGISRLLSPSLVCVTDINNIRSLPEKPWITAQAYLQTNITTRNSDLPLATPYSYCPQQEKDVTEKNKTNPSVDYGMFEGQIIWETTYKPNLINNKISLDIKCNQLAYQDQMDHQLRNHDLVEIPLTHERGTEEVMKGYFNQMRLDKERTCNMPQKQLFFIDKGTDNTLDICKSHILMSTVKVWDGFNLGGHVNQAEEQKALMISDLNNYSAFPDKLLEKHMLENSFLNNMDKPYTSQRPATNLQTDILDNMDFQGSYKMQHGGAITLSEITF